MKVSPLLVMAMSVVIIGGTLYAAVAFLVTPRMPSAVVPGSPQANDPGGGDGVALAALRHDLELLRTEMHAGRSTDADTGRRRTESDRMAETQHEEMADLREEVARLRTEVTAVQQWIHVQRRRATSMAPGKAEDPTRDPRTDPAARAEAERERQKQMEVVEADFRHEPADPRWSFEAEGAVQEALASDEIVQNTLLGLECRSHTCRVELADDDTGELAQVMPLFLQQLAQTLPSVTANYIDDGNGGKSMILYMSRASNEPPRQGK